MDVDKYWATLHPEEGVFPNLNHNSPQRLVTQLRSPTLTPVPDLTDSETNSQLPGKMTCLETGGRPLSEMLRFTQAGVVPSHLAQPFVSSPLPHSNTPKRDEPEDELKGKENRTKGGGG